MSFIGKNIRKIRSVKKLSQTAFAELFELSRASVGSYEEGRAEPKIDNIIEIAKYFSINIDSILKKELSVNEISGFELIDPKMTSENGNNLTPSDKIPENTVPILTSDNIAEFLKNPENITDKIEIPKNIPKSTSVAFVQNNNTMQVNNEGIDYGDILFGSEMPIDFIFDGYIYMILLNNEILVRKVIKKENLFIFKSINKNQQPIIVKADDIKLIYKIEGITKSNINHFID
ncbi:MAG: helix-turn-helix domain-containing protein [Ichthyobacteriaceae bacterium]|nr:helix-turn-helix domain-containing protein [Ichthyobacteriaceae bacterium]